MKLIIPILKVIDLDDARLLRLAEALGVETEIVSLELGCRDAASFFHRIGKNRCDCITINSAVLGRWLATDEFPPELVPMLYSCFPFVLARGFTGAPFCRSALRLLSAGRIQSIKPLAQSDACYVVSKKFKEISGSFCGLSFGNANQTRDYVMATADGDGIDSLITVSREPVFARIQLNNAEVFFTSSQFVADLDTKVNTNSVAEVFSCLMPPAMFLRHAFGEACWRPSAAKATLIIDDPPLWNSYGFLNYQELLAMMEKHNFHTSIAFIPYYYRKGQIGAIRLFRENPARLSMCYHGNDHTAAELASNDIGLLNTILETASTRMEEHLKQTGIAYDKVMVFPQGNFSREAMSVLRAQNFSASVNSGHIPFHEHSPLTLAEMMTPSVLKYSDFPLFIRKYPIELTPEGIAYDVFFGKPLFLVEHHDGFKDPSLLLRAIDMINDIVPEVEWVRLQNAVQSAYLTRRIGGCYEIRAFGNGGRICNFSKEKRQYCVEWNNSAKFTVNSVCLDGLDQTGWTSENGLIRIHFELQPEEVRTFLLTYKNDFARSQPVSTLTHTGQVHLRRKLSEFRDNYLSKNPALLYLAKSMYSLLRGNNG